MSTGWWSSAVCYLTGLRVVMILTLLAVMNGAALAGDFVLDYAIDADGKTDTGKLENCNYEQICEIRATGLIIEIVVRPKTTSLPTMDMSVLGPSGCCYTAGVVKQFHSTLAPDLLRVPLYRRAMRERDEFVRTPFVRNERIGTIYLEFFHLH
jgi:hypothetical protein